MFQKQIDYAIPGAVIGFIIGAMAGFGVVMYNTTKGQRAEFTVSIVLVSGIALGIGGIMTGVKIGEDAYEMEALGLNDLKEGMFQGGRYWAAITAWVDPRTGKEVKIITAKNDAGTLVSVIGEKTIMNHNINSGSNANVSRYHTEATKHVFRTLKQNYGNGKSVEDIF